MIASDITRLAMNAIRQEGGFEPEKLINAFIEAVGKDGTLIIPSFNFNLVDGDAFDLKASVPITGALAEVALQRDDFIRTSHPLHSFLVYGKDADELAKLQNESSFGVSSPFAFFNDNNVNMLMIGTDVTDAFTFVHHVEEMETVRYRKFKGMRIKYKELDGREEWKNIMLYAKKPGWTMNLELLEELFRNKGLLRESSFNGIPCSQIRLGEAYPVIRKDILDNNALSISRFDLKLFLKEKIKKILSTLHLYQTLSDKISHGPGPR